METLGKFSVSIKSVSDTNFPHGVFILWFCFELNSLCLSCSICGHGFWRAEVFAIGQHMAAYQIGPLVPVGTLVTGVNSEKHADKTGNDMALSLHLPPFLPRVKQSLIDQTML